MEFTKKDIDNLRVLLDNLVQSVSLEPDEIETTNKMYAFLDEEEKKL